MIADIMHIGWVDRTPAHFGFDLSPFPSLLAWHQRMLARPGTIRGLAALS